MSNQRKLERDNRIIAAELGTADDGHPKWAWKWSDDLFFQIHKKSDITGELEWDHKANPESGLIELHPVYTRRSMCPMLKSQWVLCSWMPAIPEAEWFNSFGRTVPYINGYWAPTNVELPEATCPWDSIRGESFTTMVVQMAKRQRAKSYEDHLADGQKIIDYQEKEKDRLMSDQIDDLKLAFPNAPHLPGKRGGAISTPFTKQDSASAANCPTLVTPQKD